MGVVRYILELTFWLCRPVSGAAQALEDQGLPVPAAELHPQGVEGDAMR